MYAFILWDVFKMEVGFFRYIELRMSFIWALFLRESFCLWEYLGRGLLLHFLISKFLGEGQRAGHLLEIK